MKVTLFDRTTIDSLQWLTEPNSEKLKGFLDPLVKNGVKGYIDNVDADVYALQVESITLPVVVVNDNYTNSYVCSLYGHYISQALETDLITNKFLKKISRGFSKGLGKVSRKAKINSVA